MIFSITLILLVSLAMGLPMVLLIAPKINKIAAVGLSYILGIGVFTLLMFIGGLFGIKFSLINELILLATFSAPLIIFGRSRLKNFFQNIFKACKNTRLEPVEKVMIGILAFLLISSFISTLYWPAYLWDSVSLYDFRGRVFAGTGLMMPAFINGYHYNYPLLTSLAHTLVYLGGGIYPQFIHSAFYLSLGLTFYGFLREFTLRKAGLLFTLVLMMTGPLFYHSIISYTNLAYTVYLALGAISIFLWDKKKDAGYLVLSALLIGLSTWTRSNEPFWLGAILITSFVSIYRKKIWSIPAYLVIVFPIREVWRVFQSSLSGAGTSIGSEVSGYANMVPSVFDWQKWGQVISYLYKYTVVPWGGIFAAFMLALIITFILKKQKDLLLMFLIVFVFLGILVVGTYFFTAVLANWFAIGDAAQRLSILFYPLFIYSSALTMGKIDDE